MYILLAVGLGRIRIFLSSRYRYVKNSRAGTTVLLVSMVRLGLAY
jgi:hypothetical protein